MHEGAITTGAAIMTESLRPVALALGFLAFWFVLNRWVLPRFGFKT
jgi:hypothetical protein